MPVFKDFAENGDLLRTREEPLDANNFERYVKENGIEKAQGYLDAIKDITDTIDGILDVRSGVYSHPNTAAVVRTQTRKFYEDKAKFLKYGHQFLTDMLAGKPPDILKP